MASVYFENLNFFRDLVSGSSSTADPRLTCSVANEASESDTTICTRIRPLSVDEEEAGHIAGVVVTTPSQAALFEPRRKVNGAPGANKFEFDLDRVYDANTPTERLYADVAQELVPWVWAGGVSTLFAYGQTGSGKTFTVAGISELVVRDMMAMAAVEDRELFVCCFEILGKKAYDLLDNRRIFSIMEDSFGTMQLVGVREASPTTAAELLSLIHTSSQLRTSAPTAKNPQSSRSHAVFRIRAVDKYAPEKPDGELFLVDLAGSEGSRDAADHSKERLAETKDINTSLSVLKDCIRGRTLLGLQQMSAKTAKTKMAHIPWRSSKLTQTLKHVFDAQDVGQRACKTIVVACVAPSIVDSAHSKNTLRYAQMLRVPIPKTGGRKDRNGPSGWSNEKAKEWIEANSGSPAINASILAPNLTGPQIVRLPQPEFIARCMQTPGVSKEQAVTFYQKLWRLHIDSRTQASQSQSGDADEATISESRKPKLSAKPPFQQRIKPGMFIRLAPFVSKIDMENGDIAMVMSPASAADFDSEPDSDARAAGQGNLSLGEDRQFVCAAVAPSIMTAAYELFVERQGVCKVKEMTAEVLMEYDQATRYYYMDL